MPTSARETLLCRYHYDPLDRLAGCAPLKQPSLKRFYCKSRLASEIQGEIQTSIFQHNGHLLAEQQHRDRTLGTRLLATDAQRSVLQSLSLGQHHSNAYTLYGQRTTENGVLSLLGFNGERPDPVTGHYLLGNGYRSFNPMLMRFNSPDSLSPFGYGGVNAYAYCSGDPVNNIDPSGHSFFSALSTTADWMLKGLDYMAKKIVKHIPTSISGAHVKDVSNTRTLSSGIVIFDDWHKEKRRLNIIGHSEKNWDSIEQNGRFWDAYDILDHLEFNGIDFEKYKSIRMLSCYSADNNLGRNIAHLTGLQTKAFLGPVSVLLDGTGTNRQSVLFRKGFISRLIPILPPYQPVTFYPRNSLQPISTELIAPPPIEQYSNQIRRRSI